MYPKAKPRIPPGIRSASHAIEASASEQISSSLNTTPTRNGILRAIKSKKTMKDTECPQFL